MRVLALTLGLLACAEPPDDDSAVDPDAPAPLVGPSAGSCPDLSETAHVQLKSNGVDRDVLVYVPLSGAEGAPVLFFWHPLGATAQMIAEFFDFQVMANAHEVVVVMPDALPDSPYEWTFWTDDGGDDAVLYDDLRACLVEEAGVDVRRIHTTGISAGGLWSTWLSVRRADTLASSVIMSGGTGQVVYYETPAAPIPVLVMWGGPSDVAGAGGSMEVDFHEQSLAFVEALHEDEHVVVACDHHLGHTIPLEAFSMLFDWVHPHAYGEPSPFAGGDLTGFPSYCHMPGG